MSDDQLASLILAAAAGIPAVVLLCVVVFGAGALMFLLFAWIIQPDRIAVLKVSHSHGVDCWCGKIHPAFGYQPRAKGADPGKPPTIHPEQIESRPRNEGTDAAR